MRIALVVSRYHSFITDRLEAGARATLREAGVGDDDVETFAVPGAYEIAQAAARIAQSGDWSAVICLGCLIRGAQTTGVPMAFGVLTTNTADEALSRAGDGPGNKGREAASAAVEMAQLFERIPGPPA